MGNQYWYDDYELWEPEIEQDSIREGIVADKMPKQARDIKSIRIPRKIMLEEMLKKMDASGVSFETKRVIGGYQTSVNAKVPFPGEWIESKIITAFGDVSIDKAETVESACTTMIFKIQQELGVELNDLNWLEKTGLAVDKANLYEDIKILRLLNSELKSALRNFIHGWKCTLDGLGAVHEMAFHATCHGIIQEEGPESHAVSVNQWYDLTSIEECAKDYLKEGTDALLTNVANVKKLKIA